MGSISGYFINSADDNEKWTWRAAQLEQMTNSVSKKKKKYFKKSATINKQKTTQVDKIIQTRFMQIRKKLKKKAICKKIQCDT